MNREIKFRAWDGDKNEMCEDGEAKFFLSQGFHKDFGNIEYMQFTGLKDKNGVEVYEDDIVRIAGSEDRMPVDYTFKITWRSDCYCMVAENEAEWLMMEDIIGCEVIGNVFDNPELNPNT